MTDDPNSPDWTGDQEAEGIGAVGEKMAARPDDARPRERRR